MASDLKIRVYNLKQWRKQIEAGNRNMQLAAVSTAAAVEVIVEVLAEISKTVEETMSTAPSVFRHMNIEERVSQRVQEKMNIIFGSGETKQEVVLDETDSPEVATAVDASDKLKETKENE